MKGLRSLRKGMRWVRSRFSNGGLILLYHRVTVMEPDARSDPFSLCVSVDRFAEQMEAIRAIGHPISLQQLAMGLIEGNLPPRSIAVTFDDGYADNLYQAKPVLENFEIPATVFVISGFRSGFFWWDELAGLLLSSPDLPRKLSLQVDGSQFEWEANSNSDWEQELLHVLYPMFRTLSKQQRKPLLRQLAVWSGAEQKLASQQRPLSVDELVSLADGGVVSIGAHTTSHIPLAKLSTAQQDSQVKESKVALENILSQPVTSFSYPYGSRADFTAETVERVQNAGFLCACTAEMDVVRGGSNLYKLPRFWVRNWRGEQFVKRVCRWLHC